MPNKHKNRKKPQVVMSATGLPTPPPTPQDSHDTPFDVSRSRLNKISTSPPTNAPTSYDFLAKFASTLSSIPIIENGVELDMDRRASHLTTQPLQARAFTPPTFNAANATRTHIPIVYHRLPGNPKAPGGHGIKQSRPGVYNVRSATSSVLIDGLYAIDHPDSHKRSSTAIMSTWLETLNGFALDWDLDLKSFEQHARLMWRIMSRFPRLSSEVQTDVMTMLGGYMDLRRIQLARPRILMPYGPPNGEPRFGYDGDVNGEISNWALQDDIIQYHTVFPMNLQRTSDPDRDARRAPEFGNLRGESQEYVMQSMVYEMNKLCQVVDVNNASLGMAMPVALASMAAAVDYYSANPIRDHVQASPTNLSAFISVSGERLWTSAKGVAECRAMRISEMDIPKRHTRQMILCRVVTRPRVHGGISFLVEDTASHVIPVTIMYPFPFPAISYSPETVQTAWPIGTVLYIKEPYVRFGARGRAEILVAWPKDLVEMPRGVFNDHPLEPTAQDLALFQLAAHVAWYQDKHKLALRLASIGLNLASLPQHHTKPDADKYLALLVGRAVAYSTDAQPGAAFTDCLEADRLALATPSKKHGDLSRRVRITQLRVSYQLKLFSLCRWYLKACDRLKADPQLLEPYRSALKDREEELKGIYKPPAPNDRLDRTSRATYVGPIKVVIDPIKGRKVIISKNVKAGELLLMEPPVVNLDHNGSPGVILSSIVSSGDLSDKPSPHHTSWALHKIMDDPSIGQVIHSLAPDSNVESANLGLSDQERLRIFNKPTEIEVDLLDRQIGRNAFGRDGKYTLYGMISMLSHSCKQNVVQSSLEEDPITVVRALNDMKAGEEVLISYVMPERTYESRHTALLQSWFFECDCALCKADQKPNDMASARARLMESESVFLQEAATKFPPDDSSPSGRSLSKRQPTITRLLGLVDRLNSTYAPGRTAKLELAKVCFILADLYFPCDATKSLKFYMDGYSHLEWKLNTPEEIKQSGRFIHTVGYCVDPSEAMPHITRLKRVHEIYRQRGQNHVDEAVQKSFEAFFGLFVPPTFAIPSPTPKTETQSGDFDMNEDRLRRILDGERLDGPLSQQELDKMITMKTLPNGETVRIVNTKGTMLEGYEKEMMAMWEELDAMKLAMGKK